jgi:hypothetical protein
MELPESQIIYEGIMTYSHLARIEVVESKSKGGGKINLTTVHEGPEGE